MSDTFSYRMPPIDLVRENLFWLRIFRDHCQFIMDSLAPSQTRLLTQARQFYQIFDQLLEKARDISGPSLQENAQMVMNFRAYKLGIVNLQLAGQVPINLPPGALNEMLDEDDEYLRILNVIPPKQPVNEVAFLLHQHLLWLPNNVAHAALIRAQLDPGEAALFRMYHYYCKKFIHLANKVMELNGLLRDNPRMVPALAYTTRESATLTREFRDSLENYIQLRTCAQVLAISPPLLADHLAREAAYYLEKIGCNNH